MFSFGHYMYSESTNYNSDASRLLLLHDCGLLQERTSIKSPIKYCKITQWYDISIGQYINEYKYHSCLFNNAFAYNGTTINKCHIISEHRMFISHMKKSYFNKLACPRKRARTHARTPVGSHDSAHTTIFIYCNCQTVCFCSLQKQY